jgi:hypothetical protein
LIASAKLRGGVSGESRFILQNITTPQTVSARREIAVISRFIYLCICGHFIKNDHREFFLGVEGFSVVAWLDVVRINLEIHDNSYHSRTYSGGD